MSVLLRIAGIPVSDLAPGVLTYTAGLAVDADGDPRAYHPDNKSGLDWLGNARADAHDPSSSWVGVVARDGVPVVQGPLDPAPGFYVLTTALGDPRRRDSDPLRYVPSASFPYAAVPPQLRRLPGGFTVGLGDVALVEYRGQWTPAIVADVGPRHALGEASIFVARQLGIDPSPKHGGVGAGVKYTVWAGSAERPAWPVLFGDLLDRVLRLRAGLPRP